MGIRFRCHQCGHELHVKDFQAGKRSRCPTCETKFRIPNESSELSLPIPQQNARESDSAAQAVAEGNASQIATGTLASKSASSKSVAGKTTSYTGDSASLHEEEMQRDDPEELQLADGEATAAEPLQSQPMRESAQTSQPTNAPPPPQAQNAQPQAIVEAPGANWYVRPPAGGQYGPAPADIFCEWLTENRVTRDSLVWRDGWPQWLVAGDVFPDYFGPAILQHSTAGPGTTPVAAPEQSAATVFVAPLSLSDRAVAARKRQRKKNYMIMIAVLATTSIGLVVALVVVLMKNS